MASRLEEGRAHHRALVFPLAWEDPRLDWLLAEFRLLVNESIRTALQGNLRSRVRLTRAANKDLVRLAKEVMAAVILEDLTLHGAGAKSKRMNRRLSSWPRREIHRQIEYKAALAGVPVIKVNPAWTSKTCPACGARRRDRVGKDFVCLVCDWEMERQINAGLNILKTALASNEALARAVRFQPGALRDDALIPLYDLPALPVAGRRTGGAERSGVGQVITQQNPRTTRKNHSRESQWRFGCKGI